VTPGSSSRTAEYALVIRKQEAWRKRLTILISAARDVGSPVDGSHPDRSSGDIIHILEPMPKYVIEREIEGAGSLSEERLRQMSLDSLQALGELGPKIQWIHSFVTDNKVYCIYVAPDEETIREHARRAGMPVDRVSAVRHLLDPVTY
jgi:hypothetical protein